MPTSVGSSLRSWLKASSPPAEAPMPTIGKDRKSTRLNSSHSQISYAVFCLKKKTKPSLHTRRLSTITPSPPYGPTPPPTTSTYTQGSMPMSHTAYVSPPHHHPITQTATSDL